MGLEEYIRKATDGQLGVADVSRLSGTNKRTMNWRWKHGGETQKDMIDEDIQAALYASLDELINQVDIIAERLKR